MKIRFHKTFLKQYDKLSAVKRKRFDKRLITFQQNPNAPVLRNHSLSGKYGGFRSINIGGDIRAIYEVISADCVQFIAIGSHC